MPSSNKIVLQSDLPQGSASGRFLVIERLASNGLLANYKGDIFVYMEAYNDWRHVASQEAMVHILALMDVTNVTVTYLAAIMPYVKYMERVAVKVRSLPLSVCLGHFRLDLAMANGMIVSNRIAVRDDSNQHDLKGFCVLSNSKLAYYKQWGMTDVCSLSRTLSYALE